MLKTTVTAFDFYKLPDDIKQFLDYLYTEDCAQLYYVGEFLREVQSYTDEFGLESAIRDGYEDITDPKNYQMERKTDAYFREQVPIEQQTGRFFVVITF